MLYFCRGQKSKDSLKIKFSGILPDLNDRQRRILGQRRNKVSEISGVAETNTQGFGDLKRNQRI